MIYPVTVVARNSCARTIKSYGALGLAQRVLRYALVVADIRLAHVPDGEPHVDAVTVLRVRCHVLLVGEQHRFRVAKRPVVYRLRVRLGLAVDRHVRAGWGTDQLIRYPDHRRNCTRITWLRRVKTRVREGANRSKLSKFVYIVG